MFKNMGKGKAVLLILVVLSLVVVGNVSAQKTYTIRFNTTASPTETQVAAMQKFADVAGQLSGGKLQVKVFHSGQLGDQKTGLLGVMKGSLEMTSDASPLWFADLANYPEIGVLEAAYLYRDVDHLYSVLKGPIGQRFFDNLARRSNLRVLDVWYLGTRELDLTRKVGPVRTPSDLRGVKLRMPNAEQWLDVGRALGANPTPLGFGEVYLGLKTGTIEGQDNPVPTDWEEKFFEVTHYPVMTDHMIGYVTPVINEKLWQEMPENYRYYIKKAMEVARFYMNQQTLEKEVTLVGKAQEQYGIEVIIPDKQAFMENARRYYSDPKFDKRWGAGAYSRIQQSD
jgi:tripartite ATP-independent transporter DctP family solute receptor